MNKILHKNRDYEDQSCRDNLHVDGVRKHENESWNDTEEVLKYFVFENLGLRNIKIERTHITGAKKRRYIKNNCSKIP